jgi:cytochrome c-type biogenesis protein CcmE
MEPGRKRRVRLVVAFSAAVIPGPALVSTSFSASSAARSPGRLLAGAQQPTTQKP